VYARWLRTGSCISLDRARRILIDYNEQSMPDGSVNVDSRSVASEPSEPSEPS